jgi:phytoene dehydrogenase-like protein
MKDFIIIGGGAGGSVMASLLKNSNILLLEKSNTLGGSSSTFEKKGEFFNAGATTLVGLEDGLPLKKVFELSNTSLPNTKAHNPSVYVMVEDKMIYRYKDIDKFISHINEIYPHPSHEKFWREIYNINLFLKSFDDIYFNHKRRFKTFSKTLPKVFPYFKYIFKNAQKHILEHYPNIPKWYLDFFDHQILSAAQDKSENVNFLVAALSLGYLFFENHYVYGGMGKICEALTEDVETKLFSEVTNIKKLQDRFIIKTKKEEFESKNVIINSPIFESINLVEDKKLNNYYNKTTDRFNDYQGAFVVYMSAKIDKNSIPSSHIQLISEKKLTFGKSESVFVSFSEYDDEIMTKNGYFSITISTHTDVRNFENISKAEYKIRKDILEIEILELVYKHLPFLKSALKNQVFSATPKTFKRFINRSIVGGIPLTNKNFSPFFPSPTTHIKGLYNIGDTVFAGQGWPGIAIGGLNLFNILKEENV